MQAAQQTKGWALIRAGMDQLRDAKCRPLPYAVTSDPYGTASATCSLALVRGGSAYDEVCDQKKWQRDKK